MFARGAFELRPKAHAASSNSLQARSLLISSRKAYISLSTPILRRVPTTTCVITTNCLTRVPAPANASPSSSRSAYLHNSNAPGRAERNASWNLAPGDAEHSVTRMTQAQHIPIRTQLIHQRLLRCQDLGFLGLADHLNDVTLRAAACCVLVHERIHQAGRIFEVRRGAEVCIGHAGCVEHQMWHGHGVHFQIRRTEGAHDRPDHV